MGFMEAVKTCFSKFATFEGRARRAEFWMFYLFLQIIGVVGYVLIFVVAMVAGLSPLLLGGASEEAMMTGFGLGMGLTVIVFGIYFLAMLVLTIPYLAVTARRLHDMGQSAHWLWLHLVGFGIVPVIMAFFDSEWGQNRWGPDPKAQERAMYAQAHPYGYGGQPQYGQQPGYGQQQYGQQPGYGQHLPPNPPPPPAV